MPPERAPVANRVADQKPQTRRRDAPCDPQQQGGREVTPNEQGVELVPAACAVRRQLDEPLVAKKGLRLRVQSLTWSNAGLSFHLDVNELDMSDDTDGAFDHLARLALHAD